jgi:hypothetical protein
MVATNYYDNLPYCETKDKGKRKPVVVSSKKKKQTRNRSASEERKIREEIESKYLHTDTFP